MRPGGENEFQQAFLARLDGPLNMTRLLDYLPKVYFYCKDTKSRFVTVNRTFFRNVTVDREEDVIARRIMTFSPPISPSNRLRKIAV